MAFISSKEFYKRHINEIKIIGKCNLEADTRTSEDIFRFVSNLGDRRMAQFINPNKRRKYPI